MQTTYNNAGEVQGIIISKNDENFEQYLLSMVSTIDEHPFYRCYFSENTDRILISQESGNIASIKIKHVLLISIEEESIRIMCKEHSISIEFDKPAFIIY
jgi:hypothetical protein